MPATIARVTNWVPTAPFTKHAVYRRPKLVGELTPIDQYTRAQFFDLFGQGGRHFAQEPPDWEQEYGWEAGVPAWVRIMQREEPERFIGPQGPPDFYLDPDDELCEISSTSGIISLTVVVHVLGQSTVLNQSTGFRLPNLMTRPLSSRRYSARLACFLVIPHLLPTSTAVSPSDSLTTL